MRAKFVIKTSARPKPQSICNQPVLAAQFGLQLLEVMSAVGALVTPLRLRCKVLLLGETTVGKTSICQTFCSNGTEFPKNYLMTICCDLQVKVVQIPDTSASVELFIYDCSGQDIFREQLIQIMDGACAVVYVYAAAPAARCSSQPACLGCRVCCC
jgi:hypothetical protein